jgi:hypothetical protein
MNSRATFAAMLIALVVNSSACSIKRFAINKIGDALASGGSTYTSDDDIDLVAGALPFSLKLVESLIAESPKHKGLRLVASQGFTCLRRPISSPSLLWCCLLHTYPR